MDTCSHWRTCRHTRCILARHRPNVPPCRRCGIAHAGAAWSPVGGWHDYKPSAA